MIVKVNLDEDTATWLEQLSSNECRSKAQQILYFLKKIKEGQISTISSIDVPIASNQTEKVLNSNFQELSSTNQSQLEPTNIKEVQGMNLEYIDDSMLDF